VGINQGCRLPATPTLFYFLDVLRLSIGRVGVQRAGFEVSTLAKFQFRNFSNELNFFLFLGSAIGPRKGLIGEDRRRIRLIHSTATTRITQVVQPAGNLYYFFQA